MRRLALVLPVVILAIAAVLWGTYRIKVRKLDRTLRLRPRLPFPSPSTPAPTLWKWGNNKDGKPKVQIAAEKSRYLKDIPESSS